MLKVQPLRHVFSRPKETIPVCQRLRQQSENICSALYSIVSFCQTPLLSYWNTISELIAWPSSSGSFIQIRDLHELTAHKLLCYSRFPRMICSRQIRETKPIKTKTSLYFVSSLLKVSHQKAWWKVWLTGSDSPIGANLPSWIRSRRAGY